MKKIIKLSLIIILVLAMTAMTLGCVKAITDLTTLDDITNLEKTSKRLKNGVVKINNDIDFNNVNVEIINLRNIAVIDFNNHKLINVNQNNPIFKAENTVIKNLILESPKLNSSTPTEGVSILASTVKELDNVKVTGAVVKIEKTSDVSKNVGLLAGQAQNVKNIDVQGEMKVAINQFATENTYEMNVGGVVGSVNGKSENIVSDLKLTVFTAVSQSSNFNTINVGGIFGKVETGYKIENLITKGDMDLYGSFIGGVVGSLKNATLVKAKNISKNVKFSQYASGAVGGIVGIGSNGVIEKAQTLTNIIYNQYDNVAQLYSYVGGIMGEGTAAVKQSEVIGNITANAKKHIDLGGIVGRTESLVENCLIIGNVYGHSELSGCLVGGIVGRLVEGSSVKTLKNNISIGGIAGQKGSTDGPVGGIYGYNHSANNVIKNNHYSTTAVDSYVVPEGFLKARAWYGFENDPDNEVGEHISGNAGLTTTEIQDNKMSFSVYEETSSPNGVWIFETGKLPRLHIS